MVNVGDVQNLVLIRVDCPVDLLNQVKRLQWYIHIGMMLEVTSFMPLLASRRLSVPTKS